MRNAPSHLHMTNVKNCSYSWNIFIITDKHIRVFHDKNAQTTEKQPQTTVSDISK